MRCSQPQSGDAHADEVNAGIGVIAGNTVSSIPERLSVRYYKKCAI